MVQSVARRWWIGGEASSFSVSHLLLEASSAEYSNESLRVQSDERCVLFQFSTVFRCSSVNRCYFDPLGFSNLRCLYLGENAAAFFDE